MTGLVVVVVVVTLVGWPGAETVVTTVVTPLTVDVLVVVFVPGIWFMVVVGVAVYAMGRQ